MADKQKHLSDAELVAIRQRVQQHDGRAERQLRTDALALLAEVDRLRAGYDRLMRVPAALIRGTDTEHATLMEFADRVIRDGWNKSQDSNGDVWCKGCGVQLYSLGDTFTSTHRSGCPVLKVIALVARTTTAGEQGQ